ncbi:hypothetical protein [Amorphus sp. 3PC139-8]|uniref:hypothetical protein n=1 Tax=Amorphus sp. 3PC139-8 TaxID=2735676 RepID=UPI00345D9BD4
METEKITEVRSENSVSAADAEMAEYGITRVPVDHFHYREFRYTNLKDAIAQAERDGRGR